MRTCPQPRISASWTFPVLQDDRFAPNNPGSGLHGQIRRSQKLGDDRAAQQDPSESLARCEALTNMHPRLEAAGKVARNEPHFDLAVFGVERDDLLEPRRVVFLG